jgi:DNA-binding CsgD family transcriptional regulator
MAMISYRKVRRRTAYKRLYPARGAPITTTTCPANLPVPRSADASRTTLQRMEERAGVVPSERELELLLLAARGLSNRQIAALLSEATVKRHLPNLYAKVDVGSRGEATRKALLTRAGPPPATRPTRRASRTTPSPEAGLRRADRG